MNKWKRQTRNFLVLSFIFERERLTMWRNLYKTLVQLTCTTAAFSPFCWGNMKTNMQCNKTSLEIFCCRKCSNEICSDNMMYSAMAPTSTAHEKMMHKVLFVHHFCIVHVICTSWIWIFQWETINLKKRTQSSIFWQHE